MRSKYCSEECPFIPSAEMIKTRNPPIDIFMNMHIRFADTLDTAFIVNVNLLCFCLFVNANASLLKHISCVFRLLHIIERSKYMTIRKKPRCVNVEKNSFNLLIRCLGLVD